MKRSETKAGKASPTLPLVSIVFVTYKRLERLRDTYWSLREICRYPNLEWIVCDDGSSAAIQTQIRKLAFDQYLLSERNQGMGANTNKGLLAANGDYVLHLQDDWTCSGPSDFIESGVELMGERPDVCMVQFWRVADFPYPSIFHLSASRKRARIFLDFPGMVSEGKGFHIYSDRPHLKRRSVTATVGLYSETIRPVAEVEEDYCNRFEQCADQRVGIIEGYDKVFKHTGEQETFNPRQRRENWRRFLRGHPVLRYPWNWYVRWRYGRSS